MIARSKPALNLLIALSVLGLAASARAGNNEAQLRFENLRFENHHFTPQTLSVPAGQPLTIIVVNDSKETIEFESFKLNRETAMEPGQTIKVKLPALSPGDYDFYDDFHDDVPQGSIVAK